MGSIILKNRHVEDFLTKLRDDYQQILDNLVEFRKERLYDSSQVLKEKHVEQILLERYLHEIPNELMMETLIDGMRDLLEHYKKVYLKIEHRKVFNNIEQLVYIFNQKNEKGEYEGEEIYKEDFYLLQMRVQKKIQSGLLGFFDDKNKEYIEETDIIKTIKTSLKDGDEDIKELLSQTMKTMQKVFHYSIYNLYWLPSSPFMFNQMKFREGTDKEFYVLKYKDFDYMTFEDWEKIYNIKDHQYGSCYSMGSINDNLEQIYEMLKLQQMIFKHQGGFGQNFSKLRSKYQKVKSIGCNSTGQISFMRPFNNNTSLVQLTQNTKRGQNMFILDIKHPEITDFIDQKTDFDKNYENMKYQNISVNLNNEFLDKLFKNEEFYTVDPSNESIKFKHDSRELWQKLILNQTLHSEPGILNLDFVNEDNPLRGIDDITSVNPCVTGDTLVLTKKGLVEQKNLKIGMEVWSSLTKKFYPINKVYNNGLKDIYQIKLENGQILRQTPEHKVYTKDGWKEVKDLTKQDKVYFETFELIDFSNSDVTDDVVDLMWLLGLITSNGKMKYDYDMKKKIEYYSLKFFLNKVDSSSLKHVKEILNKYKVIYTINELDDRYKVIVDQVKVMGRVNENVEFLDRIFKIYDYKKDLKQRVVTDVENNSIELLSWDMDYTNIKVPFERLNDQRIIRQFVGGFIDGLPNDKVISGRNIELIHNNSDVLRGVQQLLNLQRIRTKIITVNDDNNRLVIENYNRINLELLVSHVYSETKIENLRKVIKNVFKELTDEDKYVKVEFVNQQKEQEIVYDIEVKPDYVWITNGILSYDCQEFNGQDRSVCNLGSVNLYQFVDKNFEINTSLLEKQTKSLHTFLNLQNFQNDFILDELTHNTRRYRNTGLGYMGLQSVLLIKEIEYGSKEQYELFKRIMKTLTDSVLSNSKFLGSFIGGYDKFEMNKNIFTGEELNNKFNTNRFDPTMKYYMLNTSNPETQIELQEDEKIQNQRMMQIAPTGCRIKNEGIEFDDGIKTYREIIKEQFDFDITDFESGKYVVFQVFDKEKNKVVWRKIKNDKYVLWYINNTSKYIKQKEIEEGYFIRVNEKENIIQVLYVVKPKRFYTLNKPLRVKVDNQVHEQKRLYINGFGETYELWSENNGKVSECSGEHKWMIYDTELKRFVWKETKDIVIGDIILSKYGLEKISDIQVKENYTYDIEVKDVHIYFTEKGFYSHNSISFISQVSSGVEPIFSLQYERRINPDMQNEYKVVVVDTQLKDYLKHKLKLTNEDYQEVIKELTSTGESKVLKDKNFIKTIFNTSVQDKLQMLHVSNHFIDMNTSTTFNIQSDTVIDENELEKLKQLNDEFVNHVIDRYNEVRFEIDIDSILKKDKQQLKQTLNYIVKNLCVEGQSRNRYEVFIDLMEDGKFNNQTFEEMKKTEEFSKFKKIIQQVNDFYLLSQLFKIKGTTVYVEGSRTPILKRVKKKQNKKVDEFVLNIGNKQINIDDKGYIKPRKRPVIIQQLKKTVYFKLNGDGEKKIHVEIGFDIETNEPFEIFFRSTETSKEFTEFLNMQGRLLSTMLRQGMSIDDQLKQMKKVKTWRNEYFGLSRILQEVIEELIRVNKLKGKKRKEELEKKEEQKDWIMTSKGYYIDEEGTKRCPVCGERVYEKDGCIECLGCGWTQCIDNLF